MVVNQEKEENVPYYPEFIDKSTNLQKETGYRSERYTLCLLK
jgi:hypothetical protein